ncbi:MAG: type transport system permease protein [Gaiellaceae bacterium]|jgi:ABC-2 type transport system permease protein|nr:type transport system permease protein [Gaiellaceae bacterium]
MTNLRIFFLGGLISYRALFSWMSPSLFFLTLVVQPIFQILLFAYIGRAADVRSDEFYVVGNAMQYAAVPCLFAMTQTIAGERYQQTLGYILISPAGRLPLFLGRALPVILNGFFVAAFSLIVGGLILGVTFSTSVFAPLAVVVLVSSVSCTGLGLINAGLGLRIRETSVLSNILVGILLIFCGANVAISSLPHWMAQISSWLPLTHAIEAARAVADGRSLTSVEDLLGRELGVGLLYAVAGLAIIRFFETQSRRHASLGIA